MDAASATTFLSLEAEIVRAALLVFLTLSSFRRSAASLGGARLIAADRRLAACPPRHRHPNTAIDSIRLHSKA